MRLKHFNIMRLIYCVLLALPFVAILSRVIYVQSNKNAYQSYYGETINNKIETQINNINEFTSGEYKFNNNLIELNNTHGSFRVYIHNFQSDTINLSQNCTNINFYSYPSGDSVTKMYCAFYNNNSLLASRELQSASISFYCYVDSYAYDNQAYSYFIDSFYKITYNNYSYLDNVFEYSVNKFIQNNNFGKINLFQWTTDLFFDSNDVNNMYVGFINWYLNYTLLVSATYILFLVLMWFINYARRLLERGMNYDW